MHFLFFGLLTIVLLRLNELGIAAMRFQCFSLHHLLNFSQHTSQGPYERDQQPPGSNRYSSSKETEYHPETHDFQPTRPYYQQPQGESTAPDMTKRRFPTGQCNSLTLQTHL